MAAVAVASALVPRRTPPRVWAVVAAPEQPPYYKKCLATPSWP